MILSYLPRPASGGSCLVPAVQRAKERAKEPLSGPIRLSVRGSVSPCLGTQIVGGPHASRPLPGLPHQHRP